MAAKLIPEAVAPWLTLAALAAVAVFVLTRRTSSGGSVAGELGAAVGGAAVDAGAGVVVGIGQAVGIPRTDADKCRAAIEAGDYWRASFDCPAGDFIGAVLGRDEDTGSVSGSW